MLPEPINKALTAGVSLAYTELFNEGYAEAQDPAVFPFQEISEVLDGRTCALCRHVDGMIVATGSPEHRKWREPSHIGCRRTLTAIHADERGVVATFEEPGADLVRKHGHYHTQPDKYAELRIPAEPAGRHVVVRRLKDVATGEIKTRLDWAPWWAKVPQAEKDLVLKLRASRDAAEVKSLAAQLGVTDLSDPGQFRRSVLLGIRDRLDGWVDEGGTLLPRGQAPLPVSTPPTAVPALSSPPTVSGSPTAGGPAVADALLRPGRRAAIRAEVDVALAAIDRVHGDGRLPVIPIGSESFSRSVRHNGAYWPRSTGKHQITVTRGGPHQALTMVHEVAHFLDEWGLGNPGEWAMEAPAKLSPAVAAKVMDFRRAVDRSSAVAALRAQFQTSTWLERQHLDYLLSTRELWARAYAQWVAGTSGDATLRTQLQRRRRTGYYREQWEDADFAPISDAVEALFRELGWMRTGSSN